MYEKIQECGLIKIIPFTSAIWCQYLVFYPSWTFLGLTIGSGYSPDAANHRYSSSSWVSLRLTSSLWRAATTDVCDILVYWSVQFSSVQSFSHVWLFATSWTAAHQPSCPSPTPGVCSDSYPLNWWCHPIVSSSVILPSIFPSIRVFSNESALCIRLPKYWNFNFSISPSSVYLDWFPSGLTGWISLQSKGLSRIFSYTTVQKHQLFGAQLSLWSNSHIHTWLLEKP